MIKKRKILIVDDDNRNVFAMEVTLKSHGFECISASSAEQCMKILKEVKDISCVLMDMMLPEIDGYEAIGLIKNDPDLKQLKVIAVTARAMQKDRDLCIQAGADAYVPKPVNVEDLLHEMNN